MASNMGNNPTYHLDSFAFEASLVPGSRMVDPAGAPIYFVHNVMSWPETILAREHHNPRAWSFEGGGRTVGTITITRKPGVIALLFKREYHLSFDEREVALLLDEFGKRTLFVNHDKIVNYGIMDSEVRSPTVTWRYMWHPKRCCIVKAVNTDSLLGGVLAAIVGWRSCLFSE